MIENVNNNQIQKPFEKPSATPHNPVSSASNNNADVSLQADIASLIEKAVEITAEDNQAVRCARELLQTGRLDTPENIRTATDNIIQFGI